MVPSRSTLAPGVWRVRARISYREPPMRATDVIRRCVFVLLATLLAAVGQAPEHAWAQTRDANGLQVLDRLDEPARVYSTACASCHGADGRGAPKSQVGFETPLPDFTDCNFASREPDADWSAVIHDGGPARGFGRMMPAFGSLLTDRQIEAAVAHLRAVCGNDAWPRGELNLPRPLVTEKAYPEDELVWTTTLDVEGSGSVMNEVVYEHRIGARNQIEVAVPFGFQQRTVDRSGLPVTDWKGGLGDVAVGVKRDLFHSHASGTIASLTAEAVLPTGDPSEGFGKGSTVFEPFASFGQILPGDAFLHAQVGLELPTGPGADEGFWRLAVGRTFVEGRWGRAWSPMVELLGKREFAGGEPALWDVVPQMQVTLSRRQHIMANVGVLLPLNEREGRSAQLLVYVLWDWFDGGPLEGW
jgi:mono/diheme cytochrome c family protein